MPDIVLKYKRTPEWLMDGEIVLRGGLINGLMESSPVLEQPFKGATFDAMMTLLGQLLREAPDAKTVEVQRTDKEGLIPTPLDSATIELLRTDTEAAIKAMVCPPIRIDLRQGPLDVPVVPAPLRAGYDTLAESFGDETYTKHKNGKAECPGCGRWADVEGPLLRCNTNASCGAVFPVSVRGEKWAAIQTSSLLCNWFGKFYLPREWNTNGVWITWEQLNTKYEAYIKEKESCSDKH